MADFPVKVEDVVAVAMLGVDIPLDKMVSGNEEAEYEPEHSDGVVYKPGEPGVAALIFSSGKVVCTGTKSIGDARKTIEKVVEKIKGTGVAVPSSFDVKIESIVASSMMPSTLDLDKVASSIEDAEYKTTLLPGPVYRLEDPKVSVLILESGKIICTGAKSMEDVRRAIRQVRDDLKKAGMKEAPKKDEHSE